MAALLVFMAGCPPSNVTVPNVSGMTQSAAGSAITVVGLAVGTITEQFSETVSAGHVISQDPAAGTLLPPSNAVNLVVSKGPDRRAVPTTEAASCRPAADLVSRYVSMRTSFREPQV